MNQASVVRGRIRMDDGKSTLFFSVGFFPFRGILRCEEGCHESSSADRAGRDPA